jgi:hypothetical protein
VTGAAATRFVVEVAIAHFGGAPPHEDGNLDRRGRQSQEPRLMLK